MGGKAEILPMGLLYRMKWGMALVMGSAIALTFLGHSRFKPHPGAALWIWILCGAMALLVGGTAISYSAERWFKRGMDVARWSDMELETVRSWLDGRAPTVISVLTLVCFAGVFWALRWNAMAFLPALIFPLGSVGRLLNILQGPQAGIGTVGLKELKPLRSEWWGR
ncbi:MAG TPA: hypothetical protein VHU44_02015 [Acidobacteriaceae bacterium]|nr:hypothetical protein [Acidobacteriaceae bacterium]